MRTAGRAVLVALCVATAGCVLLPEPTSEPEAPARATVLDLTHDALAFARGLDPNVRVARAGGIVDASGGVIDEAVVILHLHAPKATYPDAWRRGHADAGRFVEARVNATTRAVVLDETDPVTNERARGLVADLTGNLSRWIDSPAAVDAADLAAPLPRFRTFLDASACGGAPGWWVAPSGSDDARVVSASASTTRERDDSRERSRIVAADDARPCDDVVPAADGPLTVSVQVPPQHAHPREVSRGSALVLPVTVTVSSVPSVGAGLALDATGVGPDGNRSANRLPAGVAVAFEPEAWFLDAPTTLRVNVTFAAAEDAVDGRHRFTLHARSNATLFVSGLSGPVEIAVVD